MKSGDIQTIKQLSRAGATVLLCEDEFAVETKKLSSEKCKRIAETIQNLRDWNKERIAVIFKAGKSRADWCNVLFYVEEFAVQTKKLFSEKCKIIAETFQHLQELRKKSGDILSWKRLCWVGVMCCFTDKEAFAETIEHL